MMGHAQAMTGLSVIQVDTFCAAVREEAQNFASAAQYTPGAIL